MALPKNAFTTDGTDQTMLLYLLTDSSFLSVLSVFISGENCYLGKAPEIAAPFDKRLQ